MATALAVRCRGLTKHFGEATALRAASGAVGAGSGPPSGPLALDGVDLDVAAGESLGIIGPNGAGKSTLLRVLAGIAVPTAGSVDVAGSVRSVIELGAGFHPDLTGIENLRCLGVLHGRSLAQVDGAADRILDFAGLAHAADLPLKQYSLGMRARLAFAVVTDVRPDVLVVDEVLAVGDQEFQAKCFERIAGMVAAGTTLLLVSHEMSMVASTCQRVVQLRHGRLVDDGPARDVIERYLARSAAHLADAPASRSTLRVVATEVGSSPAAPLRIHLDLDLDRPIAHAGVGFDVVLPMIDPDQVVSASTGPLGSLAAPGRYRVTGIAESLWGVGRDMRLLVRLVDRDLQRVVATATHDLPVVGDLAGRRLSPIGVAMTTPMAWSIEPLATTNDGAAPEDDAPGDVRPGPRTGHPVARLAGVTKRYRSRTGGPTLRPALPGRLGRPRGLDVRALDAVDLDIHPGEAIGLIGPNASGKTTLLRVLAGVTRPEAGDVVVRGRTVSLLELGSGFHADLTGRENLAVLGRLMGVTGPELAAHVARAIEFAGMAEAIDQRLKTYSTGMTARLGLAMALVAPADLLLVDEVLAVGDEDFRRQAIARIAERCRAGLAVVFVSHDLALVEQVCERVVRLDRGRLVQDGPADRVLGAYAGRSWAGGVHDAEGGVRLHRLGVDRHHVPTGGSLTLEGVLDVDEPQPDARLEVALRAPPDDRDAALSLLDREMVSAVIETVVAPGAELARPGRYRFRCRIDVGRLVGQVDLVVAAVDPHRQVALAEVWEQVVIGSPEPDMHVSFDPALTWSAEPWAAGGSADDEVSDWDR